MTNFCLQPACLKDWLKMRRPKGGGRRMNGENRLLIFVDTLCDLP